MRVGEQRERQPARRGERPGLVKGSRREGDDLDALIADLLVSVAQLREMPAAVRSAERAQEHEQDLIAVAVAGKFEGSAARARECEVGRLRADRGKPRFS